MLTCAEFQRRWNDRLDSGLGSLAYSDPALEAHAASCPTCRALATGYHRLALAVESLARDVAEGPGIDFAERVAAAVSIRSGDAQGAWWRAPGWLALAASVLVALTLAVRAIPWSGSNPRRAVATSTRGRPIEVEELADALADATNAGLALALEASAPAARIGSEVLGEAEFAEAPSGLSVPPMPSVVAPVAWREVGERVNAGIAPLSGSARSAFGFLLPATRAVPDDHPDPAPPPRPPRGA